MQYHAPTNQFTITVADLPRFAASLRHAIKKVREAAGLPLEGGPREFPMTAACHAEYSILHACMAIGIDLGATRPGQLDVRDAG